MIPIPEVWANDTIHREGDAGRNWIALLPQRIEHLCAAWGLSIDGDPLHGYLGLVVPVKRGDDLCVLKVSWQDESTCYEARALAVWAGRGAVRLLEANEEEGALLLERLDSRRSLNAVDIGRAARIAGPLLRRLAVPAPDGFPRLSDYAADLEEAMRRRWEELGRPLPRSLLERACGLARERAPSAADLMVNADLHYGNVLASEREPWLAIDPKVLIGDPEYGAAPLLWRRLEDHMASGGWDHSFHVLIETADLDPVLARNWSLVRCVDYGLWGWSVGLTEDPARCQTLIEGLS